MYDNLHTFKLNNDEIMIERFIAKYLKLFSTIPLLHQHIIIKEIRINQTKYSNEFKIFFDNIIKKVLEINL